MLYRRFARTCAPRHRPHKVTRPMNSPILYSSSQYSPPPSSPPRLPDICLSTCWSFIARCINLRRGNFRTLHCNMTKLNCRMQTNGRACVFLLQAGLCIRPTTPPPEKNVLGYNQGGGRSPIVFPKPLIVLLCSPSRL